MKFSELMDKDVFVENHRIDKVQALVSKNVKGVVNVGAELLDVQIFGKNNCSHNKGLTFDIIFCF